MFASDRLPPVDSTPTEVRVVKPCLLGGQVRAPGYTATLPRMEALYAASTGRCELVEGGK